MTPQTRNSCMPELPEVQNVVDSLRPLIARRIIQSVVLRRTDISTPPDADWARLLTGKRIRAVRRRGKRIYFDLDDGNRFFVHLGMTGRLRFLPCTQADESHTHLIFMLSGRPTATLRFIDPRRFGGIYWEGSTSRDDDSLGPEPLEMTSQDFATRLKSTSRPVKSALLDQRLVAGLGNIYVDEALHLAGIRPTRCSKRLQFIEVERLVQAIRDVLNRAIAAGGSTLRDYVNAVGDAGNFQKRHLVYGRENKPCQTCTTPIRRIVLAGRSTHFCPACQSTRRVAAMPNANGVRHVAKPVTP